MNEKVIYAVGLMSGTSLDGLDIAYCRFVKDKVWTGELLAGETIVYTEEWKSRLEKAFYASGAELWQLHADLGHFMGKQASEFISRNKLQVDLLASHGHTVFHQPDKGFTCQIGDGAAISAESGLSVVCDFRSLDVALKGQGAPLVPAGDEQLFHEYSYCLNLGGIANVSLVKDGTRLAFDICSLNQVLNRLAEMKGYPYDKNGELAKAGSLHEGLLEMLNRSPFYKKNSPKSLGREHVEKEIWPILESHQISVEDKIHTFCEHAAFQIGGLLKGPHSKTLTTGGGAHNTYLCSRIQKYSESQLYIPPALLVDFKEAFVFAFLGVLRYFKEVNVLKSVTGAKEDNIGGAVYHHSFPMVRN